MAFRKKAHLLLAHKPDIVVIPECEHPDKLLFAKDALQPSQVLWFGKNKHKGLGIFSYSNYRFKVLDNYNPDFKMVIPVAVSGGQFEFTLFAVWANNPEDKNAQYIEQVWNAIHHYENILSSSTSILIGDFNSNTIWDRKRRVSNHSNVVKLLQEKQIVSLYHQYYKQLQGSEKHPTLYMYRHRDKPYHIDYCFASKRLAQKLQLLLIGEYDFWCKYSDHVPLIAAFSTTRKTKK